MHLLCAILSEGSIIDLDASFFIQLLLFAVAFFVLKAMVFDPMLRLFDAREEKIDGAKKLAHELESGAENKASEFDAKMRDVRSAAAEKHEALRADAKRMEASILDKVRSETSAQLDEAAATLTKEAAALRKDVAAQTPVIAKMIAGKLLHREVQ